MSWLGVQGRFSNLVRPERRLRWFNSGRLLSLDEPGTLRLIEDNDPRLNEPECVFTGLFRMHSGLNTPEVPARFTPKFTLTPASPVLGP
jgi:hypothetical protein